MKTFKEYLSESKKVYSFKIKVAGELPEKFQENLKAKLDRCKVMTLEKVTTTPVQKLPLDFPTLENKEVTVFEVVCEYPVTGPEIVSESFSPLEAPIVPRPSFRSMVSPASLKSPSPLRSNSTR